MLACYNADLHIHTALSPCADNDMTPARIIHGARAKGLQIIAVTDHNSCANASAVQEASIGSDIAVIPGMEVQTREEVHMICLFADIKSADNWQHIVHSNLPNLKNKPALFGNQYILDKDGLIVAEEERLLLTSTALTLEDVINGVSVNGGICFPAHIDRPSYSLLANLGFIPEGLSIETVEISTLIYAEEARFLLPVIKNYNIVGSSDAHSLSNIGAQFSQVYIGESASYNELSLALRGQNGRKVVSRVKELSMHIADIIQNSIEAGATSLKVEIIEDHQKDVFRLCITDNGRGMDKEIANKVMDPFFTTRTTRRVGLGIPLLKAAAERCDGTLVIDSSLGAGTIINADFLNSHIDRAPLGNIVATITNTIAGYPELDLIFAHTINGHKLEFNAPKLRKQLEDIPMNNPAIINWIRNYLAEGYKELNNM